MGLRRKLKISLTIWIVAGFFLIWAGLYISEKFILLLLVLFAGLGIYLLSLKCPNCGNPVLRNKIKIFGIEIIMWTPWIASECEKCKNKLN